MLSRTGHYKDMEKASPGRDWLFDSDLSQNKRFRLRLGRLYDAASALTRFAKRDTLRDAVFLCRTPFVTPRISSG